MRRPSRSGAFSATSGATLRFGGGTHEINSGATIGGTGTMRTNSGEVNINSGASVTIDTIEIAGGTTRTFATSTDLAYSSLTATVLPPVVLDITLGLSIVFSRR